MNKIASDRQDRFATQISSAPSQLSREATAMLAERLRNPPPPNKAMRRAFTRKERLIASTP